jgi:uncharacterized delta-60 repeat protein
LDPNFGGNGKVTTGFGAETTSGALDVGIQADGRIVAAGASLPTSIQARFALTRYRPNGSLDAAFGGDGKVTTVFPGDFAEASSLAIQGGRIVAAGFAVTAGTSGFALARYLGS